MAERHSELDLEALASETLSHEEVREILERLSAQEFGGSELSTVGAISEATGATPVAIGRMLAEIRQENLHDLFGRKIELHETKISTLEEETERLRKARPEHLDPEVAREIEKVARERIRARQAQPFIIFCAFLFFLVVLWVNFYNKQRSTKAYPPPNPVSIAVNPARPQISSTSLLGGGTVFANEQGDVWVITKEGVRRPPTESERELAVPLQIGLAKKGQR